MRDEGLRIPILLSVIAGMVDLTGFVTLSMFPAHITGNLVIVAALLVRGGQVNPDQILALPVFMSAVAATWLIAKASGRRGPSLMRRLLLIHFLLITCVFYFQYHHHPVCQPPWPESDDRRDDRRICNGLSIYSFTSDASRCSFNGCKLLVI